MADGKNKNKSKNVDDAGIRLAPTPMQNDRIHVMPSVMQEFVITPKLQVEKTGEEIDEKNYSSDKDYQPKKEDIGKKWKRDKRTKNIIIGVFMFLITAVVILPYILSACHVYIENMPFKYVPREFGAIGNIVDAFKISAKFSFKGAEVNAAWIECVPSLVLAVGFLFLAVNLIKSIVAVFGATKPMRYTICSFVYLVTVLAVLIASVVGVNAIGLGKINFVNDFIRGYKTSELFSLTVFAVGNFILSLVFTVIGADKNGYIK